MAAEVSVATMNLWGFHTPAGWLRERGELRGATPASRAASAVPADRVIRSRRTLAAGILGKTGADVIALQENARRAGGSGPSHAASLARSLGMTAIEAGWAPTDDPYAGPHEVGVALLTDLPVLETRLEPLPFGLETGDGGCSTVLCARIDADCGPLWILSAHLPSKDEGANSACAESLAGVVTELASLDPVIVCGDMNADPESPAQETLEGAGMLSDLWRTLRPDQTGATMPLPAPERRLDRIFLGHAGAGGLIEPKSIETFGGEPNDRGLFASDHLGLVAFFQWMPDPA